MTTTTAPTLAGLLASPEPFRAWLANKPPGEIVGVPQQCSACPIARFLREQTPGAWMVDVDGHRALLVPAEIGAAGDWDNTTHVPTPEWARTFIVRIDCSRDDVTTAAKALRVLSRIGGGETT